MRYILTIFLLLCALLSTACSFGTYFAVVNGSDQPIEVRYQAERSRDETTFGLDPVMRVGNPFLIKASPLRSGSKDGELLSESEYQVDRIAGTIIVRLLPGEILSITTKKDYKEENDPPALSIEEINITGAYGEIRLRGKQVGRAFAYKTSGLYTMTYK